MILDPGNPQYEGHNVCDFPSLFPGYIYPVYDTSMEKAIDLAIADKFPKTGEEYMQQRQDILYKYGFSWLAYVTAKPGEKIMSNKVSYDKVVKGPDGKIYVPGSGVYLAD